MFNKAGHSKGKGAPLAERLQKVANTHPAPRATETAEFGHSGRRCFNLGARHHHRERDERKPVFREAEMTLPVGEKLPCAIKNLNEGGARIDFFRRMTLPNTVYVHAPSLGLDSWARVVWQTETAAGVDFEAA